MYKDLIIKIVLSLHLIFGILITINVLISDNLTIEGFGILILLNIFLYIHYIFDKFLISITYQKFQKLKEIKE